MIEFEIANVLIKAQSKPDLFSPKALDIGTKLLLDSISTYDYTNALDWGCGWGAIGLWLAKHKPEANITTLDSDIAAIASTKHNVDMNNLTNIDVLPSHSFDELPADATFDLICSNPPTHRGREVVDGMIAQSFERLQDGGRLVLVVEARIKPWVAREMTKAFGNYKILKRGPKNVVLLSVKA